MQKSLLKRLRVAWQVPHDGCLLGAGVAAVVTATGMVLIRIIHPAVATGASPGGGPATAASPQGELRR